MSVADEATTAATHAAPAPTAHMDSPASRPPPSREDLQLAEQLSMLQKSGSDSRHYSGLSESGVDVTHDDVKAATDGVTNGDTRPYDETAEYHSLEDSLRHQAQQQQEQSVPSPQSGGEVSTPQAGRSHVSTAPITGQVCR